MEATAAMVKKKTEQMFHPNNLSEIMDALNTWPGPERERVQLAMLKLSEGRIDKLHFYVKLAFQDYRDVLAPAEYPKEMQRCEKMSGMAPEKAQAIRDDDRRQYLEWLNSSD